MSLLDLLDRPIAFHRIFVKLTGSVTAALMLSQALYWSKRTSDSDGWFYKVQTEWEEETGMGRYEQEGARKSLRGKSFWEEKRIGCPAKLFYRINLGELESALTNLIAEKPQASLGKTSSPVCGKTTILIAEKPHSLDIQRILTENTAKITSHTQDARTENQKEGEVVEPSQGFCEEERPEPKLEALTPINPTGLSRPILHSPTPQVPPRPLRHDFLPEQGSGVYLWNENAKFTVYIPTGDKNRMESACAAFVFKQHEKLSEPSETTANCWLSAVKMLRTNIWQQQQRGQFTSTSIEVIAEEVNTERDMPRLAEVFSSDLNFSIVSVENQRATLVGTAKIAAYTTNPRLSLTLTASLQDQKEVNTWLTMCEFFVPTVTNVEPMTLGHGSRTPNPAPKILPFGQSFNNPASNAWFEWQTGPGPNDYDPEFVTFLAGKWNRSKADVKRFFQKNRSNPEAIAVYFEDFKGRDAEIQQAVMNVMRRKLEEHHGLAANW